MSKSNNGAERFLESPDFLEHLYRQIWLKNGAEADHADAVARAISFGDRFGKINQGLGVFEVIDITFQTGTLDIKATPELVNEGPTWAVYEGNRTSGHWMMTIATKKAIEIAREMGMGIAMSRNHNDAGCFSAYTTMAIEQGMICIATNNSPRLVAPFGGMENMLSGAPFSAAAPGGEEAPLIMDTAAIEAYDADVSEAYFAGTKMKAGKVLVDPDTGELSDDPVPYIEVLDEYARLADSRAATVFKSPKLYAVNCLTEVLSTLMVPGATITPDMPYPIAKWFDRQEIGSVGGSSVLVIDPSKFGPIEDMHDRSDRFVRACKSVKPRPGVDEIRMPGERGWKDMQAGGDVEVLKSHWASFQEIANKSGVDIDAERSAFKPPIEALS
ncbi:Ldh family oxidoreductase [Rhodobacteraceae bacterium nBUS_24]